MRNYVPENTHAGLRTTPRSIQRLHITRVMAYKHGFAPSPDAVIKAIDDVHASKFKGVSKSLKEEDRCPNMKGEHCNILLANFGATCP